MYTFGLTQGNGPNQLDLIVWQNHILAIEFLLSNLRISCGQNWSCNFASWLLKSHQQMDYFITCDNCFEFWICSQTAFAIQSKMSLSLYSLGRPGLAAIKGLKRLPPFPLALIISSGPRTLYLPIPLFQRLGLIDRAWTRSSPPQPLRYHSHQHSDFGLQKSPNCLNFELRHVATLPSLLGFVQWRPQEVVQRESTGFVIGLFH